MRRGQLPPFSQKCPSFRILEFDSTTLRHTKLWGIFLKHLLDHRKSPSITRFCPLPCYRNTVLNAMDIDDQPSYVWSHAVFPFQFQFLRLFLVSLIHLLHLRKRSTLQTQPNMFGVIFINRGNDTPNPLTTANIVSIPKGKSPSSIFTFRQLNHFCGQHWIRWASNFIQDGLPELYQSFETLRNDSASLPVKRTSFSMA